MKRYTDEEIDGMKVLAERLDEEMGKTGRQEFSRVDITNMMMNIVYDIVNGGK